MLDAQRFTATLEGTKAPAHLPVPFDPNLVWRPKDAHHVHGTLNGRNFRGKIEDGRIALGPALLRDHGLALGDSIEVIVKPEGHLSDNVAPDIAEALRRDETVRRFFDSLPTFYRNNFLRDIDALKSPEARARKISKMVELLREGKREK